VAKDFITQRLSLPLFSAIALASAGMLCMSTYENDEFLGDPRNRLSRRNALSLGRKQFKLSFQWLLEQLLSDCAGKHLRCGHEAARRTGEGGGGEGDTKLGLSNASRPAAIFAVVDRAAGARLQRSSRAVGTGAGRCPGHFVPRQIVKLRDAQTYSFRQECRKL